ncbi:unnamed protein product [Pneumocystis jirovecii]|nr:unnamed protein product [Pneumocystis jirovecii]CCJ31070.1 unnamed protein product [Pneumocystis jirovecii]
MRRSISSSNCIIKKVLNEMDQLHELQKNIDNSFSQAGKVLWKSLKNLDSAVSQLLKKKSINEYEKWKSSIQSDFDVYKKMKLDELEKKKLDYDIQLRKFVQERIQFKNMELGSLCLRKKDKISKDLEEELGNIELPIISSDLESFFEEIEELDTTNLIISEKDSQKKYNAIIDIIEDEDFNLPE